MRAMTETNSRLYAIIDVDTCQARGLEVVEFARAVCAARPRCIQLRAKHSTSRDTLNLLRAIVPLARSNGVLSFANDRPDLAMLADADGVHVGQDDLPVAQVREIASSLRVGVSTNGEAQLRAALAETPDYVACGPIFSTASKPDAEEAVGISGLADSSRLARAARIPLVAIGGINRACLAEVFEHADLVAMIAALVPESGRLQDVTEHVVRLMS
jgi:thiamine-phosphate pyrophosphorylase